MSLAMRLTVFEPDQVEFVRLSRRWFEAVRSEMLGGVMDRFAHRRVATGETYRGWIEALVQLDSSWLDLKQLRYSGKFWDRIDGFLAQRPLSVETKGRQNQEVSGRVGAAFSWGMTVKIHRRLIPRRDPHPQIKFEYIPSGWVQFGLSAVPEVITTYPGGEAGWVDFFTRMMGEFDAQYGEIARTGTGTQTAFESAHSLKEAEAVLRSRRYLRGHSWVTGCGPGVAARLGGAQRMRRSGAFSSVAETSTGGLVLQATPSWDEYDEGAVRRVFEAVAPALHPGAAMLLPVGHPAREILPGVVYEVDAADFGATAPEPADEVFIYPDPVPAETGEVDGPDPAAAAAASGFTGVAAVARVAAAVRLIEVWLARSGASSAVLDEFSAKVWRLCRITDPREFDAWMELDDTDVELLGHGDAIPDELETACHNAGIEPADMTAALTAIVAMLDNLVDMRSLVHGPDHDAAIDNLRRLHTITTKYGIGLPPANAFPPSVVPDGLGIVATPQQVDSWQHLDW